MSDLTKLVRESKIIITISFLRVGPKTKVYVIGKVIHYLVVYLYALRTTMNFSRILYVNSYQKFIDEKTKKS